MFKNCASLGRTALVRADFFAPIYNPLIMNTASSGIN